MTGRKLLKPLKRLAYKLPSNVTCHADATSLVLVRSFPLKSIRLHVSWNPAFSALSSRHFVPLEKIAHSLKKIDLEKTEILLNDLVRKGYLEQEGVSMVLDDPFISIIIPVHNRPDEIRACLKSLVRLDYPSEKVEIIIVDDASTDHTTEVIKEFDVKLISLKHNKKASFCRNLAAQKAKGDILAFIDSDCISDPLWLSELIPAFKDPAIGAVGGQVDSFFHTSDLDKYEQVMSSLIMGTHAKRSKKDDNFFYVPSCNLLVKQDLFLEINGFKEELVVGEDVDLCWRLQDAGHHVEFRPNGRIFHKHRNKIAPFCRRRFDYGTSEPLLQSLHKNRKKQLFLPLSGSVFWCCILLSIAFSTLSLLFFCPIITILDCMAKYVKIRQHRIPVKKSLIFFAVARSYAALAYHCCSFISRYYLIWFILGMLISPFISLFFIVLHLISSLTDFFLKKPSLNVFIFIFYYSLDQLSYQMGVLSGCLKYKSFNAVNPIVTFQSIKK